MAEQNKPDSLPEINLLEAALAKKLTDTQASLQRLPDVQPMEVKRFAENFSKIIERSQRLVQRFLQADTDPDMDFSVPDPGIVGQSFMEMFQKLLADPNKLLQSQMSFWQDYMTMWQTANRRMLGEQIEPTVEPNPGDKRFKDPEWAENAVFDFYNIQNQHNYSSQISSVYMNQKKNSNTLLNTLTLHGGFVRNNIHVNLAEEHSEANVYGLSLVDGKQHVDNYTFIDHAVPNCRSNEMYKNILDDEATGAFNGRILVRPDAQNPEVHRGRGSWILLTARSHLSPEFRYSVRWSHCFTRAVPCCRESIFLSWIGPLSGMERLVFSSTSPFAFLNTRNWALRSCFVRIF